MEFLEPGGWGGFRSLVDKDNAGKGNRRWQAETVVSKKSSAWERDRGNSWKRIWMSKRLKTLYPGCGLRKNMFRRAGAHTGERAERWAKSWSRSGARGPPPNRWRCTLCVCVSFHVQLEFGERGMHVGLYQTGKQNGTASVSICVEVCGGCSPAS